MKGVIWLQLPTEVVRNEGFDIDEKTFTVYAFLTYAKFRSYEEYEFEVNHHQLKKICCISDNRTLKKCFDKLYIQKLIKNKVESFPRNRNSKIKITLTNNYKELYFTQLPVTMLNKIESISCYGYRLLYYYESFINRKTPTKDFCYPSYESIQKDLKIGTDTISKYNTLLNKEKYIQITRHEVKVDDILDDNTFTRYNNHYKVNLHNMVKKKK